MIKRVLHRGNDKLVEEHINSRAREFPGQADKKKGRPQTQDGHYGNHRLQAATKHLKCLNQDLL